MKEFGGNLMDTYETVLRIEKGRTQLPENFWALRLALKCEHEGYYDEPKTNSVEQASFSRLETTEIDNYYNYLVGRPCKSGEDCNYITETLYFELPNVTRTFFYRKPTKLNLKPHRYKIRVTEDCPNIDFRDSDYDVSIDENHNQLHFNFNSGFVFLRYRGMPVDQRGDLLIPNTSRNKLKDYILYHCIRRTLESLMLNEDDKNVGQKLQYYRQMENEYFLEAKKESIDKGSLGWRTLLKNANRREISKYENMFRRT
jgi:hypothetical protein